MKKSPTQTTLRRWTLLFGSLWLLALLSACPETPTETEDEEEVKKGSIKATLEIPADRHEDTFSEKTVYLFVDEDDDATNGTVKETKTSWTAQSYSMDVEANDIETGKYKVYALVDSNESGKKSSETGDYYAVAVDKEVKADESTSVSLALIQGTAKATGTITAGASITAGNTYAVVLESTDGNTSYSGVVRDWASTGTTQSYTFDKLPAGDFRIYAMYDTTGDGQTDSFTTPVAITLTAGQTTNKDLN